MDVPMYYELQCLNIVRVIAVEDSSEPLRVSEKLLHTLEHRIL